MSLETPMSSQSPPPADGLDEMELTEFDEEMLRELLEEPGDEISISMLQDTEDCRARTKETTEDPTRDYLEQIGSEFHDFGWYEMMEMDPTIPCNDMSALWYGGTYMSETPEIKDHLHSHNIAAPFDEITYGGLWQDNQ